MEVSYDGPKLECFKQVSCQELSDLLAKSTTKSCALDPIPATVLKGCLDVLLPFITKLVNCSLQCSDMTESMKHEASPTKTFAQETFAEPRAL